MPTRAPRLPLPLLAAAALLGAAGCRVEDRTPRGSLRDQQRIQQLVLAYHRAPDSTVPGQPAPRDLRVVRSDVRQEGDLATAWVLARPADPAAGDLLEHFVFRRQEGAWRVVHVAVASRPKPPE